MSSTPVEDAILASFRKDAEIRATCSVSDRILLDVRRVYQLPVEPERWATGLAERLEMLNKDYRRIVRTNTQTLHTRLQNLYGRSAAAGLGIDAPATVQELAAVQGLDLIVVSTPPRSSSQTADLMCDLLTRVGVALELCVRVEDLVPQMTRLYRSRGQGSDVPLLQRILFRRDLSKFQLALAEASAHKQLIRSTIQEWRPYFQVLASETALNDLLDNVRAQKVSKKVFLTEATPVVESLRGLRNKRDDIMNQSSKISLSHEASWLLLGSTRLPDSVVAKELRKYDVLLEDARMQQAPHTEMLESLEALKLRSMSPSVVVGPGGVDIDLSLLATAYLKFREIHSTCIAVMTSILPLVSDLERDIKTLSELNEDVGEDSKVITEL